MRKLHREFDATKDFGKLLGLTLQLLDGPVRTIRKVAVSQTYFLTFGLRNDWVACPFREH